MFKNLKNNKAQAIAGEYIVVFFLVVAMITGMSIYVRRALQGRIRDAHNYAMNVALTESLPYTSNSLGLNMMGRLHRRYEPYYSNVVSDIARSQNTVRTLGVGGGSSGVFRIDYDERNRTRSESHTAPPALGN